jgi:hypothetical protein
VSDELPFYAPGHHRTIAPITPKRGDEVWRLRKEYRTQTCELSNEERAGFGWDVPIARGRRATVLDHCVNMRSAPGSSPPAPYV